MTGIGSASGQAHRDPALRWPSLLFLLKPGRQTEKRANVDESGLHEMREQTSFLEVMEDK